MVKPNKGRHTDGSRSCCELLAARLQWAGAGGVTGALLPDRGPMGPDSIGIDNIEGQGLERSIYNSVKIRSL